MIDYFRKLRERQQSEEGASAVEYGLLVAAIAAVIVAVAFTLGKWVFNAFDSTCETIASKGGQPTNSDCAAPPAPPQ
jgi:pilus assembly protein Flp/PilA